MQVAVVGLRNQVLAHASPGHRKGDRNLKTDDSVTIKSQPQPHDHGPGCVKDGVAIASCFGFDPNDSTIALQAALSSNASTVPGHSSGAQWHVPTSRFFDSGGTQSGGGRAFALTVLH